MINLSQIKEERVMTIFIFLFCYKDALIKTKEELAEAYQNTHR